MNLVRPRPGRIQQTDRGTTEVGDKQTTTPINYPAPYEGLVTVMDVSGQVPGAACILTNWLPTLRSARIRGGCTKYALVADGTEIKSSFKYKYAGIEKMFVATATAIYDVSAPPAPPATVAAAVSGFTSGEWTVFQHTNAGVSSLCCFNGTQDRRVYNGSTWGTTPAITFSDGTTMSQLNYGWLYRNRQWLLKNNSLDAYYLAVDAIGGAATVFPLGGVMKKGGALIMGFSWSLESGDGLSVLNVYVTTEGEVAVYEGTDPASLNTWALKGVYQIGKPLGKNAWIRAGGDILVATMDGLTPISQIFQRDRQAISLVSASRPIENIWKKAALATQYGWSLKQWDEQNLVFISFPENLVVSKTVFVFNVLTGKWGIIENWYTTCFEMKGGAMYFGSNAGYVYQGDITGTDDGLSFSARYLSHFLSVSQLGQRMVAQMAHMYFKGKDKPRPLLFTRGDMEMTVPNNPVVTVGSGLSAEWDVGLWDVALWDSSVPVNFYTFRQNVRASGDMIALGAVIVSSGPYRLDIELDIGIVQMGAGEQSA